MTKPDLPAIADAIVAACEGGGIRAREYEPDGNWHPTEVLIPVPSIEQVTFSDDGVYRLEYDLILVVDSANDRAAHSNLGDDVSSLRDALHTDKTLGSVVDGSFMRIAIPNDEIRDRNDGIWFGATIPFEVHT